MKKITFLLSAFLLISYFSFTQSTGNIVLNKGQKFFVESRSDVLITQEAMGQSMEIKTDVKTTNIIDVKDVKDTSYSLTNTITKMKMSMSMMGQDMNYDSEKKEDNNSEIGKSMSKVINNPKDVDINKTGKVINQIKKETKSDNADMMTGMMQNMLGNVDDGSSGINLAFQPIPAKAAVGYSWSDSTNKDGSASHTTYTIKELKGNEATVGVKGDLQITKKTEAQGMQVTSNSKGTITGESIIDISTGIVKQRNTTVETTGTVEVMGQEMPMTTKVTSLTTVKNN